MKKYVLPLLSLACILTACNTQPITYQAVPLHHDLGTFYFRDTPLFDTLAQWTHELDCDCCHLRKTRWADQEMPFVMETGWKYRQADSVCQLTLSQPLSPGCDTAFQLDKQAFRDQMKYLRSQYWHEPKWIYRQFKEVGDLTFLVIGWEVVNSSRYDSLNIQRLLATTIIDQEKVTLDFECRRRDCGNFIKRSFWLLERMQFERGGG